MSGTHVFSLLTRQRKREPCNKPTAQSLPSASPRSTGSDDEDMDLFFVAALGWGPSGRPSTLVRRSTSLRRSPMAMAKAGWRAFAGQGELLDVQGRRLARRAARVATPGKLA